MNILIRFVIYKLCLIVVFIGLFAQAQLPKPGKYEKLWALANPLAAIKLKRMSKACEQIYTQSLNRFSAPYFSSGGAADAYRHVFFMARFAQKIRVKKLRKLGIAHEKSNYAEFRKGNLEFGERPDSLAMVMDLYNNELGLKLGASNKNLDINDLNELILRELKNGKALIFKRSKNGNYVDCSENEININDFKGKWFVPKCLVSSNEAYMD